MRRQALGRRLIWTMELFKTTSGINLVHVPYKTMAQGVTDLLGGHVDAAFNNLPLNYRTCARARCARSA
jgi:tripartite-type tricarboxylate transporter receptor subunit TctC